MNEHNPDPLLLHLSQNALDSPLLIEAAAGSGKTYTLVRLALAYIIYKKIPMEHVHIVTFSRNAVEELKYRLQILIREFMLDKDLNPEIKNALSRILPNFNKLKIVTLDSFIQKIFQKSILHLALNSNFNISYQNNWLYEIAYDYFRSNIQAFKEDKKLELGFYAFFSLIPIANNFIKMIDWLVKNILTKPFLDKESIYPLQNQTEIMWEKEKEYSDGKSAIYNLYYQDFLHSSDNLIEECLPAKLAVHATTLTELLLLFRTHIPSDTHSPWKKLKKLSKKSQIHKNLYEFLYPLIHSEKQSNVHLASMASYFLTDFIEKTTKILEKNRNMAGTMRMQDTTSYLFNTIQTQTYANPLDLQGSENQPEVILIDEFQDTDSFQWTIIHHLFSQKTSPLRRYALIGDPKQLIYFFRGVTPKTYLQAKNLIATDQVYNICNNFRSQPYLISAINMWFLCIFKHTEHGYTAVKSANPNALILEKSEADYKSNTGITFLTPSTEILSNHQNPTKEIIYSWIYKMYTQKILQLLHNPNYFFIHPKTGEKKNIQKNDIACLVSTNKQAQELKIELEKRGIAVIFSQSNSTAYETDEFELIFNFLWILGDLENTDFLMNKVFLSNLFGLTYEQLMPSQENLINLEILYKKFNNWKLLAKQKKIIKVFNEVFQEYNYFNRIFQQPEGHRKFMNIRHLIAIILKQERSLGIQSTPRLLCQHLRKLKEQNESENGLLRLETDIDAVHILTTHNAKGLEYPIIFGIPDLGDLGKKHTGFSMNNRECAIIDFSKNTDHMHANLNENFEESLRKFYVLTTRAISHLFLPLIIPTSKINSPYFQCLAQLTHPDLSQKVFDLRLINKAELLKPHLHLIDKVFKELLKLINDSHSPFAQEIIDIENLENIHYQQNHLKKYADITLSLAKLNNKEGFYNKSLYINSYTSLSEKKFWAEETQFSGHDLEYINNENLPDQNHEIAENTSTLSALNISGGTILGNIFHKIMRTLPFHYANQTLTSFSEDSEINSIIETAINSHINDQYTRFKNYSNKEFKNVIKTMIWSTLNASISCIPKWKLCLLTSKDRMHEVQFLTHIPKSCYFNLQNMNIDINMGYIHGSIDLIFIHNNYYYIVDWKTSYLGSEPQNYESESLHNIMEKNNFNLQASLYMYTLGKYLSATQSITHPSALIGNVIYIFTRGTKESSSQGIYTFQKSYEEIKELFV